MIIERPRSSLEYVQVEVLCQTPAGTRVNLSGDGVDLAFIGSGDPVDASWHAGEWAANMGNRNVARVLVGPGGPINTPDLDEGTYRIYARIHATPEVVVVRCADQLAIV